MRRDTRRQRRIISQEELQARIAAEKRVNIAPKPKQEYATPLSVPYDAPPSPPPTILEDE